MYTVYIGRPLWQGGLFLTGTRSVCNICTVDYPEQIQVQHLQGCREGTPLHKRLKLNKRINVLMYNRKLTYIKYFSLCTSYEQFSKITIHINIINVNKYVLILYF